MEIEGTTKNWEHFPEKIYFERLLHLDQNIFLLGQKYSGKTTLLNECIKNKQQEELREREGREKKILKFNCLIFQSIIELRKKIVNSIYLVNSDNDRYKKKYTTLIQLEKVQQIQVIKNNIIKYPNFCLIIENAENLLDIANHDNIKKFFQELKYYLLESSQNFNYQIIILSTQNLPIPSDCFYQFSLSLPSEKLLRQFVTQKIDQFIKKDEQDKQNEHIASQISKEKKQLIEDIMTYTTIAKDFLSFKALTENFYDLKKLIFKKEEKKTQICKNQISYDNIIKKGKSDYSMVQIYYFNNFARIFQPIQEVYKQIKQYEQYQRDNKSTALVNVDDQMEFANSNKKFINKIPRIAQFLLAAFGLALRINNKSDLQIFLGYNRQKKPRKKKVTVIQRVQKKKKIVKLSRVVAICELLMSRNQKQNNKNLSNKKIDEYHSIEFYLNVDFLEKLKLVQKSTLISKDQTFEVKISDQMLEFTLKELSFNLQEFYQLNDKVSDTKSDTQVQPDTVEDQKQSANQKQTNENQTDQQVNDQQQQDGQPVEEQIKEEIKLDVCKTELLQTYGLQGLPHPSTQQLLMFPRITQTCCRQTDQMKIFDQWLRHHQKTKIKSKIDHIENHYKELIELLTKLEGFVLSVKKKLSHKNIANCKELANRILSFEITDLGPQILSNIHKMNRFFFESFQGFYHTLCDFNNHKFFDLQKKEIQYSKKFCRNISKNSLSTLIFFYKDINYYLNLIAKFMTTCDANGNYTPSVLPQNLTFQSNPLIEEVLLECKHDRNSKNWFQKCVPICENFTMTRYSEFFEPQYEKITHLFNFLKVSIEKFEQNTNKPLFNNVMPPQQNLLGRRRLLSTQNQTNQPNASQANQQQQATNQNTTTPPAGDNKKEQNKQADQNKTETNKENKTEDQKNNNQNKGDQNKPKIAKPKKIDINKVFEQEPGFELELSTFNVVFKDEGIALRENGVNTLVSKEIYNEIMIIHHDELKTLDNEQELEVIDIGTEGSQIVQPQQNSIGGNTKSLNIFISILILFLIQLFIINYLKFLNLIQQNQFHTFNNIYIIILFYVLNKNFNHMHIIHLPMKVIISNFHNLILHKNLYYKNHLLLYQL